MNYDGPGVPNQVEGRCFKFLLIQNLTARKILLNWLSLHPVTYTQPHKKNTHIHKITHKTLNIKKSQT